MDIAHLRAVFTGDTSNLDRAFDSADRQIKSFAARWTGQPKVSIYGDDSPLSEALRKATAKLNAWAAKNYSVKLDADSSGFTRNFSEASRMGQHSMSEVNQAVNGARVNAARGIKIGVSTDGTAQSVTQLAGVGSAAKVVDGTDPKISVSTNGVVSSTGQLLTLHKVVQMVHNRSNLRFSADIDRNLSMLLPKVLGDSLHVLGSLQTVGTAIHAVMVPSLIGGLGGLGAAMVPVAGAAVSLGVGLTEGVAGGLGAVGMAAGLGGAALLGYGAAAKSVLDVAFNLTGELNQQKQAMKYAQDGYNAAKAALETLTPGTHEYALAARGVALAEQQVAFETDKMNALLSQATPAVQNLIGTTNNFRIAWIYAAGAIADTMAPTLREFINEATNRLPVLTSHAQEMAMNMNGVAASFLHSIRTGQGLASITTILLGIKDAGVPAMRILTDGILLMLNVLAPLVPYGLQVLNIISQWVRAASEWSATAEGQRVIGAVWAELIGYGRGLWAMAMNVARGLWGIVAALRAAGIIDYMMGAFAQLTVRFSEFTRVGSEGQSKLTAFFQTTKPILEALGRLFGEAVYQAYRIVTAITGIEEAAPGLSGITGIIDAIRMSLEPIANLIIDNFTKLAPLVAPLIVNIAKLAEVFLAAIAPLLVFVQGLNAAFTWLTSLDPATQRMIMGMLSWVVVLGKLGVLTTVAGWISGVVGWVTKLAMGTTTLRAGLVALPAAFGPVGAAVASFVGALIAFNPVAWAVVAVMGAVAAAIYLIYQNWETVGPWLSEQWNNLLALAQTVWAGIQAAIAYIWPPIRDTIVTVMTEVWNFLQQLWGQISTWWRDTIMRGMTDSTGMSFTDIYNSIKYWIDQVWSFLQYIFPIIQAGWQLMWDNIKVVVTAVWEIIKGVVSGALYIIQGIITTVMGLITGDWQMVWDGIKLILQGVWEIIKGIVSGALTLIQGMMSSSWNYIKSVTSAVWTAIKDLIAYVWDSIYSAVRARVDAVSSYLASVWQRVKDNVDYYWNAVWAVIEAVAGYIYSSVVDKIGPIIDWLVGKWGELKANADYYWDATYAVVAYYAQGIYDATIGVVGDLISWLAAKWSYLYDSAMYYWGVLKSGIVSTWNTIYNFIVDMGNNIITAVRNSFNTAVNDGLSAIQRLLYGAQSFLNRIGMTNTAQWVQGGIDYLESLKRYARGGVIEMASGGTIGDNGMVGTGRRIVAITNEAGPEAVIAKNRSASSQLPFLQTAAGWFDSMVVPRMASGGFTPNGTISRQSVTFNRTRSSGPSMGDFNLNLVVNGAQYDDREALIEGIRSMAHDEFTALMNNMLNGANQRRASVARGF